MAGQSFVAAEVKKITSHFVPILVDFDAEKKVAEKYGVTKLPTLKFLRTDGETLAGVEGAADNGGVIDMARTALRKNGRIKLTGRFKPIWKEARALEKALEKKDYPAALRAITALEKNGHEGPELIRAQRERSTLEGIALKRFEEAEKTAKKNPGPARKLFEGIAREFQGLEVAKRAALRAGGKD